MLLGDETAVGKRKQVTGVTAVRLGRECPGAGFTVLKCQRPGSGSGLGSGRASGEMGVSGARPEPTSAPPAPGRCPGHSHPHQAPRDPPTSPGRLGNGSSRATAEGAGAQPGSLDSSPTHCCPARGGQGTGGRPCDLGQVSSPALAWGRGPVAWGPARDCPPAGSPSRAGCLCFSPCVCPSVSFSASASPASGWFYFSFSLFLFPVASLSIAAGLYCYLGLRPTDSSPTSAPSLGPPPSPPAHIPASTPVWLPLPGASCRCVGCPGRREWAQAGSEVSVQAGAVEGTP